MIDLAKYKTQIGEYDLYNLVTGQRYDEEGRPAPDISEPTELAENAAQSIIKNRFGYLPTDQDFVETATVAGVIYLLSRKPGNKIAPEEIDQRRQTFFDMLPAGAGSDSRAELRTYESKLGNWI